MIKRFEVISNSDAARFQQSINDWNKYHFVTDIKFSTTAKPNNSVQYSALIIFGDKEE